MFCLHVKYPLPPGDNPIAVNKYYYYYYYMYAVAQLVEALRSCSVYKVQLKVKLLLYRRLRLLEFLDNRHMKAARLSAPRTGRLYPQDIPLGLVSVRG